MAASRTRTKRTPEKVSRLQSLRNNGMSVKEAARELEISEGTVFRWLHPEAEQRYLVTNRLRYATNQAFRDNCKRISREDWNRRQVSSFVYVILFPTAQVLKVGKSTDSREYESRARTVLKNKGFLQASEGITIWKFPGDVRTEAYVQVMLAFRFNSLHSRERRLSEWFSIGDMSRDEIISFLNEIIAHIPEDKRVTLDTYESALCYVTVSWHATLSNRRCLPVRHSEDITF